MNLNNNNKIIDPRNDRNLTSSQTPFKNFKLQHQWQHPNLPLNPQINTRRMATQAYRSVFQASNRLKLSGERDQERRNEELKKKIKRKEKKIKGNKELESFGCC